MMMKSKPKKRNMITLMQKMTKIQKSHFLNAKKVIIIQIHQNLIPKEKRSKILKTPIWKNLVKDLKNQKTKS